MSKERPLIIPFWSTDASYPAGADPWSTTLTRVNPGAGMQASGLTPGQPFPAPHANWLYGVQGDWIRYLSDIQPSNWFLAKSAIAALGAKAMGYNPASNEFLIGDETHKVISKSTGPTLNVWTNTTLPTGTDLDVVGIADDGATLNCIVTRNQAAHNGFDVYTYDGTTETFTFKGKKGGAASKGGPLMWDANGSQWVVASYEWTAFGDVLKAYVSPDAATWTAHVIIGTGAGHHFVNGIANNGAGTLVVMDVNDVGPLANTYVSTDGGVTWGAHADVFAGAPPSAIDGANPGALAWDAGRGLFVALGASEKVWTSIDGATWANTATLPDGATNYAITVSGPYWLVTRGGAVAYSSDAGATWRNVPVQLAGAGGGTFVAARGGVFAAVDRSGADVVRSLAV